MGEDKERKEKRKERKGRKRKIEKDRDRKDIGRDKRQWRSIWKYNESSLFL